MRTSNLAQRLEELEAVIDSLRLTSERTTHIDVLPVANPEGNEQQARPRRAYRAGAIVSRDQGLRAFRVF